MKVSTLNKSQKLKALSNLLTDNHFYSEAELVLTEKGLDYLELIKKASGDSYELPTSEVLGENYKDIAKLCKSLKIELSDTVWFD